MNKIDFKIRRILIFCLLVFGLSWGFDWIVIHFTGADVYGNLGMNPWGMLVPAFVALILQIFFFKDSKIYYRVYKEKPRWILFAFLLLTIFYGILVIIAAAQPESKRIFQGVGSLLFTLWTLLIFFINGQSKQGAFERAGLGLSNVKTGQLFIGGIVFFFIVQAGLNLLFDFGDFAGMARRIYGLPIPSVIYIPALLVMFIGVTVIGVPLSGLAAVFGEEYGWRGFLQSELIHLGKIKAVLLIGIIWGIWHFPVILRGVHTYPPTFWGLLLGLIFFILWGMVQGYAVIKTGSIWIAAFMHGVVNSVYSFMLVYVVKPDDKVFSFGLGIYGLICLLMIVAFIIREPIWKTSN